MEAPRYYDQSFAPAGEKPFEFEIERVAPEDEDQVRQEHLARLGMQGAVEINF